MRELYEILGVHINASSADIKAAYKIKASLWHPDKNEGCENAKAAFQKLSAAYAILIDPDKRERYDQTGDAESITLEEEADALIVSTFMRKAKESKYAPADYMTLTTSVLQNCLRECHSNKIVLEDALARLDYLFDHTDKPDNSGLEHAVVDEVQQIENQLAHAIKGIALIGCALDIMEEYRYMGASAPSQSSRAGGYVGAMQSNRFHDETYIP